MRTRTDKLTPSQIVTITVLAASASIALVSELMMGVALPTIMDELQISASTGQWLTTVYALTLAIIIPTTGFILRRFRLRSVFAVSMGLFTLGTAIGAAAPGFELLLAGRVVQALGTGVLVPLLVTTAFGMVAPSRRSQMMALVTAVTGVAPAFAPAFSGIVMAQLSWRWLFIIVLPLAAVALIVGALNIPNPDAESNATFDIASLGLAALGFGALVYGLSAVGESAGHGIPVSFWIAVPLGALGVAAFILRQLNLQRRSTPLLDLRVFTRRAFTMSIIQFGFIVAGAFSLSVLLPLVLQEALDLGVFETGLFMVPGGLTIVLGSVIAGKLYPRVGARPLMITGAVIVAAGWWFMSTVDQGTPVGVVLATFIIICAGQALAWTPIFTLALGSLPEELHAHGSAALNTTQQLVGAVGLAVLVGIFTAASSGTGPEATVIGAQTAFTAGGIIALGGLIASLFVPSRSNQRMQESATV
ncbi:DHA2 family efflux MFS transporter permease subunit [Microbacterium sp. cf332]|uniref:DHA2 family efflux MFS transporter permease subunit n=1 Tax=Microbacterium sp. cf332 TaxID=1761804 RepID=UPI000887B826|nr:DHA2 family efflux MFS transporter permease subunit [Microbacterium sp. cf332]SDQ53576.1 MFS transporter, DHA2 family, lincomycin resistance protein [Microbacterium sp. cf332]